MLRRIIRPAVLALAVTTAACQDGVEPNPEVGNVDAILGAAAVETDSGVVVAGTWYLRIPSNGKALWLDWFFHHEFGGFPELDYAQNTRWSESWRIQLTHEEERITRNDSTIFSFVDHGDAAVEDSAMAKLTTTPHVSPGTPVGFENWVRYLTHSYLQVTGLADDVTTFHHQPYHERLVGGEPITVTTTGSEDTEPVTASVTAVPMARLIELGSGDVLIGLNADTPPVFRTDRPLSVGFDRPLDPERSYVVFIPWHGQGEGAQRAFIRPRSTADRLVIPESVLTDMVANASRDRVAYFVAIEEYHWKDDVFAGRLANGEAFSLPFVQEGETTLLVYLQR